MWLEYASFKWTKIGYACDQNCDSVSIGTVETDKVQWEEPNKIYLWYYAPGMHVAIELLYTMYIIQVVCDIT